MPTDLRPDGENVRTRGLHRRERGEEPHALEQQGLRAHERGLRALRHVFEGLPERRRGEDAVQAPEEVLRDVRFFCDPYNSQQKPHAERNREEIRRILVKGAPFDALTQEDVNLMLSHVNSAPRPSLDGKTPYDEFVSFRGERGREFLETLGIRRVSAESVVLDPILLGGRFKKEANRAILHRHGVL